VLHVVTDSTSDLLAAEAQRLGVTVVPLTVRFGEECLLDGIDLSADDFYARLPTSTVHPTTSQPSPEQFTEVFRGLLAGPDDGVVSIHLSPKWSGTMQSASLAAQEFDGRVRVVDSGTISAGLQFLLRGALRDIAGGADADTVVKNVEDRRERVVIYILLDTLTYLHRGGRIGRAQAFVGGMLNLKPVLRIVDGEAHPFARVRSRQQGVAKLLDSIRAEGPLEALATMHSGAPDLLDAIGPSLTRAYHELDISSGQLGPVVGVYAGPGGLGVALLRAR
jgi:DegV family protein with EDD domain